MRFKGAFTPGRVPQLLRRWLMTRGCVRRAAACPPSETQWLPSSVDASLQAWLRPQCIPEGRGRAHCSRSRCVHTEQNISLLQPCLFQYRRLRFGIQVNGWMTRDRYGSRLDWMMVLPVTAAGTHHLPSVRLHKLDDVPDLHVRYDVYVILYADRTTCGSLW